MAQLDAGLSACFQLQRMRSFAKFVLLLVLCSSLSFAFSTDSEAPEPAEDGAHHPTLLLGGGHHPPGVGHHPIGVGHHPIQFSQYRAFIALQAWKKAITDDPLGITKTWVGPKVCDYTGVFCSAPIDDPDSDLRVVAGIDLNHSNITGVLVPELGLLAEIGLFHLNSNFFSGEIPETFRYLDTLFELDLSNNRFSGLFPEVCLHIKNLIYLDIRFNNFYGKLPPELFDRPLDAIFVNNNKFLKSLPTNLGKSPCSVLVYANNEIDGDIPHSIGNMSRTMNQFLGLNNKQQGSLPSAIGMLDQLNIFDLKMNKLTGSIPTSFKNLENLEVLNLGNNMISGKVQAGFCRLPHLQEVHLNNNFINAVAPTCNNLASRGIIFDVSGNCLSGNSNQKSGATCAAFYHSTTPTPSTPSSSPPPPSPSPPPPSPSPPPPSPSPPPPSPSPPPPSPSPPPPSPSPPPPSASPPPPSPSPPPPSPSPPPPSLSPPPPSPSPPPPSPSPPPPSPSPPPPSPSPPPPSPSPPPPSPSPPPPSPSPPPPSPSPPPPSPPSPPHHHHHHHHHPPSPEAQPECPEGYKAGKKSGTCFKLFKERQTWAEAEYYCRQHEDGHLAAAATWDELEDLGHICEKDKHYVFADEINPKGLGCYLGGRKPYMVRPANASWTWPASPCIPFNQSFWNYGEPNNRGGHEGCITVKFESEKQAHDDKKLAYMLNDLRCDVRLPFICSLTRCTDVGCGMSDTCKSQGDWKASCHSNVTEAVGYTCDCSSGYFSDDSGTCCRGN